MYEKKPRSRVFAPLAETYRKLGMLDEALKILKVGIRNHPSYTLGYIVLANCYYDRQNYEMAYSSIRPFVSQNLENITLQKLFAKTCLNLGHLEEALVTFKNLLLINPKDKYVAEQVKLLEDDLIINDEEQVHIDTQNNSSSFDESEWVQVDFSPQEQEAPASADEPSDWSMATKSPLDNFKEEVQADKITVKEHGLDDKYFHEEYDNQADDVIVPFESNPSEKDDGAPIITHTLVDLYCNQGHFDKAIDVLESILDLHPDDEATIRRLAETKEILDSQAIQANEVVKTQKKEAKLEKLQQTFDSFLSKLIHTSKQKLA